MAVRPVLCSFFLLALLPAAPAQGPPQATTMGAIGDRGTFETTMVDERGIMVDAGRPLLAFEWLSDGTARGANGLSVHVRTLRLAIFDPVDSGRTDTRILYVDGRGETVAWAQSSSHAQETTLLGVLPIHERDEHRITWLRAPPPGTGLLNEAICHVIAAAGVSPCLRPGRDEGPSAIGPLAVRTFSDPSSANRFAWHTSALPYPVRISRETSEGRVEVATLTHFEPGSTPFTPLTANPGRSPDAVQWTPRAQPGLDETGVQAHFTATEAFHSAMKDPGRQGHLFRELVARPSTFVEGVEFQQHRTSQAGSQSWRIHLATDEGRWTTQVTRPILELGDQPALGMGDTPGAVDSVTPCDCELEGPLPLSPPTVMPEVASLMHVWQAYADSFHADESLGEWTYGFRTECGSTCASPATTYWVGRDVAHSLSSQGDSNLPAQGARKVFLLFDEDGHPKALVSQSRLEAPKLSVAPTRAGANEPIAPLAITNAATSLSPWVGIGAGAMVAAFAWVLWKLANSSFVALFTRLRRTRLLDHAVRRTLHELIGSNPGLCREQIIERVGRARGVVEHHLHVLEQASVVITQRGRRYVCYFLAGTSDRAAMTASAVLQAPAARYVLRTLLAGPTTASQVARTLGITRQTVFYHGQRLRQAGLLVADDDGRLSLTEAARRLALRDDQPFRSSVRDSTQTC